MCARIFRTPFCGPFYTKSKITWFFEILLSKSCQWFGSYVQTDGSTVVSSEPRDFGAIEFSNGDYPLCLIHSKTTLTLYFPKIP